MGLFFFCFVVRGKLDYEHKIGKYELREFFLPEIARGCSHSTSLHKMENDRGKIVNRIARG